MGKLITLSEDGPLGKTGDRVWVNDDPKEAEQKKPARRAAKNDDK